MTDRRFTDKADLDPSAVWSLPEDHAALAENRTLFPSTIVEVDADFKDRLLVSGVNSRKLGSTITKGKFKGYKLYSLTLEERATCSAQCEMRGVCYGNGMQLARRHRIVDLDVFANKLDDEIREILLEPGAGLMVRLHVLGDFPSVEYVAMWKDLLLDHDRLAVFGYTHWLPWPGMDDKGAIGNAIEAVRTEFPERFRIRWSTKYRMRDGATVLSYIPEKPKVEEGVVCPAQTDATACCASCGLCWDSKEPIAFIKHGRASVTAAAEAAMSQAREHVVVSPAVEPVLASPVIEKLPVAASPAPQSFTDDLVTALPRLKFFARKLSGDHVTADDLIQAASLKALEHWDSFKPGTNLDAWLATILRNHWFSDFRKKRREVEDIDGVIANNTSQSPDADEAIDARRALERIENLSPNAASALRQIGDGDTYDEIATREGVAVGTIKSRVSRGRDAFMKMLESPPTMMQIFKSPVAEKAEKFAEELVATHGREAVQGAVEEIEQEDNTRPIIALKLPSEPAPSLILMNMPEVRIVAPDALRVEPAYQRDLSGKSIRLIRKIVAEWDWAKMKPPICVDTPGGLVVIDGQHTAIAAASHPAITAIPVMIVQAGAIQDRAGAFVAHNRDRLTMSPFQIIHAEAVHGDKSAVEIFRIVEDCGAFIPRTPSRKGHYKAGEIASATAMIGVYKQHGEGVLRRVVSIAVGASCKPITTTVLRSLQLLITHSLFTGAQKMRDSQLADALHAIKDFEVASQSRALSLNINRFSAGARLIAEMVEQRAKIVVTAQ